MVGKWRHVETHAVKETCFVCSVVFGVFSICHVVGSLCRRYDACEIENLENLSGWSCNPELTSDMVFAPSFTDFQFSREMPILTLNVAHTAEVRHHCTTRRSTAAQRPRSGSSPRARPWMQTDAAGQRTTSPKNGATGR